jgi:hypothetical protein
MFYKNSNIQIRSEMQLSEFEIFHSGRPRFKKGKADCESHPLLELEIEAMQQVLKIGIPANTNRRK